ncbi:MAG TPA: ABC-2 family transporter protein [Polyangia bacterium]|nr:ABC-2 family transporter protein [Polyangia bacterium]
MLRYARLLGVEMRVSLALAAQYRADFVLEGVMSLFWLGWNIVPLMVVFGVRPTIAGWSFNEALIVMGWFTILRSLLEAAINPSLLAVVEHIRKGTLDFVLLKPADAQFLVSTVRFELWPLLGVAGGAVLIGDAFVRLGQAPQALHVAVAAALLLLAALVLYSVWILVISAAFWVVRLDNLAYLFNAIFDAARWPSSVFRGFLRVVFTFVIPLAMMTTYPAEALLGRLRLQAALGAGLGALVFASLARLTWRRAIAHYTSASS